MKKISKSRMKAFRPILPVDVWNKIFFFVASKPRALLAFPIVNKEFRNLFDDSNPLWQRIFHSIVALGFRKGISASQTQRIAPDIRLRIVDIPKCPIRNGEQIRRIITLRYLPTCSLCGGRRGHHPHWELGLRICPTCARRNFISNEVLHQGLGLSSENLLALIAAGAYTLPSTRCTLRRIAEFSNHPLDLALASALQVEGTGRRRPLVFFWLPHVIRLIYCGAATAEAAPEANPRVSLPHTHASKRPLASNAEVHLTTAYRLTRAGPPPPPPSSRISAALGAPCQPAQTEKPAASAVPKGTAGSGPGPKARPDARAAGAQGRGPRPHLDGSAP